MAHEIFNNQIAWANETPWHGLGTEMSPDQSGEEFLKAAGLDWEVERHPLFADVAGELVEIPNKSAYLRSTDQKVMAVASDNWTPLQNRDAIDFMQRYVTAGGAKMETVGALRDGQVVWGLARLGHSFETRYGDKSEGYLLIQSPHVLGKSITVSTTAIRVVCANTMALADQNRELHYRQSHLKEFDVDAARAMVANAHEELAAAERRFKTLDKLKLSMEDAVKKVIVPTFRPELLEEPDLMANILDPDKTPRNILGVMDAIENGTGAIHDTGWGVLAGVTYFLDHVKGRSKQTRWATAIEGENANLKRKTESILLELAA